MKKFFVFFMIAIFALTPLLAGCGSAGLNREDELNSSLESTYEELSATFSGETGQYDLVAEYLNSWASKNEITISANEESYMVLENPATEGADKAGSTAIQCSIDTNSLGRSIQSLAISLTALLGPLEHGDIALIVTETNDGEYTGAAAIDTKYLEYDNFINMTQNDDVELYTAGSYAATASMTTELSAAEPYYSNAYEITMRISGYHDPFNIKDTDYPNPVEVIGNLLASEKSSGQLFQLASFNCEAKDGYIPTSATAVVVVDSNDISSFEKRFRSSYNNMKNRFEKLEDNFVYTLTATDLPSTVISNETSDNIISLMYTLKTGTYLQDEESGEIVALSEISNVSTSNGSFNLQTAMRSIDETVINEMAEVFLTTSGLCNIDFSISDTNSTWPSKDNKALAAYFTEALGAEETIFESTLESSECDVLSAKAPLNMISYQCNIHHGEAALSNICSFLESLTLSTAEQQ